MTKRCLCPVAICFVFGLIFSLRDIKWILVPFGILGVYIFLRLKKYNMIKRALFIIGLVFASFLFGVFWGKARDYKRQRYLSSLVDGQDVLVQGRLYKKETKNNRNYLYLDKGRVLIEGTSVSCEDILVLSDSDGYVLGNEFVVNGKYSIFEEARNEGNYDEKENYYNKGIDIKVENVKSIKAYGKKDTLRERLYRIKEEMKTVMSIYLGEPYYGTLSAIVLGDKTNVSVDEKELYKNAGLSHILSVSGLHISILCMGFFAFLRKIKCPRVFAIILSSIFSLVYCVFSGASVSTQRAVGMFLVAMLAMQLGEAADMLSSLSLVMIVLLIDEPNTLFSPGFLLSFGAVIGIAVTAKEFVEIYNRLAKRSRFLKTYRRRLKNKKENVIEHKIRKYLDGFASVILSNIAITLTTFPLVLWFYFEIPTLSLIVNLLVIPLMGILLGVGFAGSVLGAIYLPFGILLLPSKYIIEFYRVISTIVEKVSFSTLIIGRPKMIGVIAYYVILFMVLFGMKYFSIRCAVSEYEGKQIIGQDLYRFRKMIFVFAAFVFVLMTTMPFLLSAFVDKSSCIKMLDVGQGDGIFIRTKNKDVFVDGGSSNIKQVGKYRIIPFLKCVGAEKIDYWIISHADEDHISGLIEALENGYRIDNLVVSKYIVKNENYEKIEELSKATRIKILEVSAGDALVMGEDIFTCLYPNGLTNNTNESSLALLYENESVEMLLTGDMEKAQEKELLKIWNEDEDGKTRILKVAHHGSRTSTDENLIKAFSPDLAIISAGINNRYKHPHNETLKVLKDNNVEIERTDISGEIVIQTKK